LGKWKYIDHPGSGGNDYTKGEMKRFALTDLLPEASIQLYDLEKDPGETNNLIEKQPAIVTEAKALLEKSKASGRSAPTRPAP
jgi:hypothetical protein